MSNRLWKQIAVILLLPLIAGCGSTRPVHYYVIEESVTPANSSAPQYPISILVARVMTSHLYRDTRIVFGSGPVEMGTYEYERWSETPSDMIQSAIVSSLRVTGQYRSVSRIGSKASGNYILRTNLYSLYEVDKPDFAARFSIQWELFDSKAGATLWTGKYAHDEPVNGSSVENVIEAMDRNVHGGLQQLTSELGQYFAAHPPAGQ
ncbi:MAG TPA: ABC-type transport auxiliary lipoprotein family protein [Candidatus Sulfotelmatobacter sp.]|nr:ABC-type transport auxiliary lipoprotein family protein [Candidatus Sulfotelmatobacter sp.]